MNLKLIFIYLGLLSTELLIAQNQITELSLKQVIEMGPYGISRCTNGTSQFPFCILEL